MKKTRLSGVKTGALCFVIMLVLSAVFTLTACNDSVDVAELSVVEDTVPTVAVAGEFNVSGIRLTVTASDGSTQEISATPSMLTTEGRQALSTVGMQTVTLYYQGKTAVITVLIVEAGTETVTVTFTDADGTPLGRRTAVKGEAITNAPQPSSSDSGKVFVGWYDVAGNKIDLSKVEADITVTAKFSDNANVYEVKFFDYKGNQVGETQNVLHGAYAQAPSYTMPYEITQFSWPGINNPITAATQFNMSVQYRSYQVLYYYAFEANPAVKYSINANGRPIVESVLAGKNASMQSEAQRQLAQQSLEFVQWQNTSTVINADTEMIALVKDRYFTITYNDGTGKVAKELSGTSLKLKNDAPQREGYVFNGEWKDANGKIYKDTITVQNDLVLTPVYNKKSTPVLLSVTFKGMKVSETGGDDSYVVEELFDDEMFYQDRVDITYVTKKLAELKRKNASYADFEVESVSYGDEDVTDKYVSLGVNAGDAFHRFDVVAVNASLPTDGLVFNYDEERSGYVVGSYNGTSKNIYIPANYDDGVNGLKAVVAIGDRVFAGKEIITVKIPDSVKYVGDGVFAGATLHNDVVFPALYSFGEGVFVGAKTGVYYEEEDAEKINPLNKRVKVTFGNVAEGGFEVFDANTFNGTVGIVEVVLPSSVTEISVRTVENESVALDEIEKIDLSNVVTIGERAFMQSAKLSYVGSLVNVNKVGSEAFRNTAIEELNLPVAAEISAYAFAYMPSLKKLSVSGTEETGIEFDMATLAGDVALKEIVFGNFVSKVTFGGETLPALEKITLGESVRNVDLSGGAAPLLQTIVVDSDNEVYFAEENVLFEKFLNGEAYAYALAFYPANKLGDYTLPATVNELPVVSLKTDFAGANINALTVGNAAVGLLTTEGYSVKARITAVVLQLEEQSIDNTAFIQKINDIKSRFVSAWYFYLGVSGLDDKDIASIISEAGWDDVAIYDKETGAPIKYDSVYKLFYKVNAEDKTATVISGDQAAESITVPAAFGNYKVKAIDMDAFIYSPSLKTLKIEATVDRMSDLSGCYSLESIVFKGWNENADCSIDGYTDTVIGQKHNLFILGGVLIGYNEGADIKNPLVITAESLAGVKEIPAGFFANSAFTEISLADSVTRIGSRAFENCASLEKVDFNRAMEVLDYAFTGCSALKNAVLSEVVRLGVGVFENCVSLESVYIPKKINSGLLPVKAFYGCRSLTTVDMPEVTAFSENSNSSQAFFGCTSLVDISFINRFDKISAFAFTNCNGIKKIDFTQTSVTSIGKYAFSGCSGIEYIVFSANVTEIGDKAFYCEGEFALKSIEFKGTGGLLASTAPINENVFPSSGYVFYVSGGASQSALSKYSSVEIRTSAPSVSFTMYEGFASNGSLNMPTLNDTLYISEAPIAPEFVGYVFAGWYMKSGDGAYYKAEFPYNVTKDTEFYAKYYDINKGSFTEANLALVEKYGIKGYEIRSFDRTDDEDVYIPAAYRYDAKNTYPIIGVDASAFAGWVKGTEIVFPEGLLYIVNASASSVANGVRKIILPSTLVSIGSGAFDCFVNAEEIVFADGTDIEETDYTAFEKTLWYTNALVSAHEENGFVVAGNVAIKYVSDKAYIEIPAGVTVLADGLFKNNEKITEVRFNDALRTIGAECFYGATKLTYVTYASGSNDKSAVKNIGENAFYGTEWLAKQDMVIVGTVITKYNNRTGDATVNIPDSITEISEYAFENCSAKTINFGKASRLETVGNGAFRNSMIESINLPAVKKLGEGIFEGCASLKSADLSATKIEELPANTFRGCSSLTDAVLSGTVASFGANAFNGCSALAVIIADGASVSKGVTESGIYGTAFCNPEAKDTDQYVIVGKILLKYVQGTVSSEGEAAETKVTAVIPDGVEIIMKGVFADKTTIDRVEIPASVKVIGNTAFSGCIKLSEVVFAGAGLEIIEDSAFSGCKSLNEFVFPDTVTKIGNSAFNGSGLREVVLGDSVTEIGEGAFKSMTKLEYVKLGNGIRFLGKMAFKDCDNLYKVDWGWTVDVVETADNGAEYNSFDVLIAEIRKSLNASVETELGVYRSYIGSIFDRDSAVGRNIRIYFNETSNNHVMNSTDSFVKAWTEIGNDINVYKEGVYPTVSFIHDDTLEYDYYMAAFNAEVIESIASPSMTGRTFKGWTVNGEALELPYRVYNDIQLKPEWFVNDLKTDNSEELGFTASDLGYAVTIINKDIEDGVLYVPSTVNGKPVISVKLSSTSHAASVKQLVLTDASAFNGLSENVFRYFPNLEGIRLIYPENYVADMIVDDGVVYSADGKTLIAYFVKYEKDGENTVVKKDFVVPDGVEKILPYAFVNSKLTTVTLGKNVTAIGANAFNDELSDIVFHADSFLTDATRESFANTVWYNGGDDDATTYGPTMTPYVVNRSTVGLFFTAGNMIYEYKWISTVANLTIPDAINGFDITVIAENLNTGNAISVENLVLPAKLVKINSNAFYNIDVTKNVSVAGNGNYLTDIAPSVFDDTLFYKGYNDMLILGAVLVKCQNTTANIVVPEGVVSISDAAFDGGQVRTITLPSTLKYIGNRAFYNCNNLVSVTIPKSVEEIGDQAFAICKQLVSVGFDAKDSKLVKIGDGAFSDCSALASISVPYTVKSLGKEAFMNCTGLTSVEFDYIVTTVDENNTPVKTLVSKSNLNEMGASAFYNCSSLTAVTVPNGVKVIESRTFYNCRNLVTVTFDVDLSEVKVIETQAFYGCSSLGGIVDLQNPSLVTLVLPSKLEKIKEKAFANCTNLLGVQLNYNIASIENDVFYGCLRLAKLDIYTATAPEIADRAFERNGDNDVKPYYNLRIYVKNSIGGTTLDNYKNAAGWVKYRDLIHERDDLPVMYYRKVTMSGTGDDVVDVSEGIKAEIIVDPKYTWGSTSYTTWKYSDFKQKTYDESGKVVIDINGDIVYESKNTDSRYDKAIDSLGYQKQTDDKGAQHVLLILDYDSVTIDVVKTAA
ncbi:MAG: leucine-rich repeat protein [Christensenellales bacterium]